MTGTGRRQFAALRRRRGPVFTRRGAGAAARGRRRRLPRPGPRFVGAFVVLLVVAAGGWMWLRNSSLVAVRQVTIVGVSGPDAAQIRVALRSAAHGMTTLNVKTSALRTAVEPYPVVKHVHAVTQFPHGMRIEVQEQVPVAIAGGGGPAMAVAGDGTLLRDPRLTSALPTIAIGVVPGGSHVTGAALAEVRLLAAAPYQLLAKVGQISSDASHGLVAQLRSGPKVYFGGGDQLEAKWAAAAAVLANASSAGADYIDVTVPSRPAAGTGSDSASIPATATGSETPGASAGTAATTGLAGSTGSSSGG